MKSRTSRKSERLTGARSTRLPARSRQPEIKYYNLAVPQSVFDQVEQIATARGKSIVDVLRKFISLGLFLEAESSKPAAQIIVREGERERQLVLFSD